MGTEQQQVSTMVPHQEFMKDQFFRKWYPKWINNAMENYPVIKKEFEKRDCCVSCLPRPMNRPCIILGGGVSLDKAAPLLKDWKHPIFTPCSLAFVPVRWDRKPDYICAFDSLWNSYNDQLKLDDKKVSWEGTTLFTHPNAEPLMIKAWKWNKYYYRRVFPRHEFFELTFPLMFPWIKIGLQFSGSVINNALTLAVFFGYSPIFTVGVDMGWEDDDKNRSINWKKIKGEWKREQPGKLTPEIKKGILTTYNGFRLNSSFLQFKNGFLGIYGSTRNKTEIVDCSNGILEEFPKANIEKVIEEQGWGDYGTDKALIDSKIKNYFKMLKEDKYIIKDK